MARNRKRARDRQDPLAADSSALVDDQDSGSAPEPMTHASSEADLAEAQLALGRPELAEVPDDDDLEEFEEEDAAAHPSGLPRGSASAGGSGGRGRRGGGAELAVPGGHGLPGRATAQENIVLRLAGFLQGSWRELQRVQWPDRRQVFQATGVVIGFVIVAGVFLGLADLVASKLVNLILK